ncbi:unnamed protein product [Psylliodes chrysocephalus]|uniref:FP protein C-terminal domain-containing protein n=1 Tax=Psylliodes chrysocephalus TaxID=3402493 RepID=A0A9P0D3B7_9CUCU|nr:unnamed protein product [Psylliodes chrysocephala]
MKFEIKHSEYGIQTLPSKESRKLVLVKLKEKSTRDKLLELKKTIKLDTLECGIDGKSKIIYINENLPKNVRMLYNKAKTLKNHGYRFVWYKNGNVYARKDKGDMFIIIKHSRQIDSIIDS